MDADVIIIGSGFAGAVAAARLVDAGIKVLVLERGPWRKTLPVEAAGITDTAPLPRAGGRPGLLIRGMRPAFGPKQIILNKRGLLEMHVAKGIRTVASSSVGGGSHIWGSVVARPAAADYWDKVTPDLSERQMASHFSRIETELGAVNPRNAEDIPNHTSYAWKDVPYFQPVPEEDQLPVAMLLPEKYGGPAPSHNRQPSTMQGNDGTYGSVTGAKASVDAIYLIPRLGENLQVLDLHEAASVVQANGGYVITARDHKQKQDRVFRANYVILAAGTMNTVKLLCASEAMGGLQPMPALGKGFGTNGDCVGLWKPGGDRDSTQGIGAQGRLHIPGQPDNIGMFMGGAERPPLPSWLPGFLAKKAEAVGDTFQVIGMGEDSADGRIRFNNGRLELDYSLENSPVYERIFTAFDLLAELSGRKVKYSRKQVMTCHPMGGCRISETEQDGVVNSRGEVHTSPGLFIADASVFTAPTGSPPTLNIAVWSSYLAEGLAGRIKVQS